MNYARLGGFLIVVGVAVGVGLSWLMPEWPTGGGLGLGGKPAGPTVPERPRPADEPDVPPATTASDTGSTGEVPRPAVGQVATVLIDGREFLLRDAEDAWQPATLDEVAQTVQAATGDEDGIRVRVLRRGSARASAEQALREKLGEVGLREAAIRWQDTEAP